MKKHLFEIICCSVLLGIVAYEEREKQFLPHHLKYFMAGKLTHEVWTTNRFLIHYTTESIVTTNGIEYRQVAKTNRLW